VNAPAARRLGPVPVPVPAALRLVFSTRARDTPHWEERAVELRDSCAELRRRRARSGNYDPTVKPCTPHPQGTLRAADRAVSADGWRSLHSDPCSGASARAEEEFCRERAAGFGAGRTACEDRGWRCLENLTDDELAAWWALVDAPSLNRDLRTPEGCFAFMALAGTIEELARRRDPRQRGNVAAGMVPGSLRKLRSLGA
jgi:hypothetical protein